MNAQAARRVTGVAFSVAVVACALLLVSIAVPSLRSPGTWALFAVPLARNAAVVVFGDRADRGLAVVGVVVVVAAVALVARFS